MKKTFILFAAALLLLTACGGNQPEASTEATADKAADSTAAAATAEEAAPAPASADTVAIPAGMTKLGEASGDLDKDGQAEAVAVFDTGKEDDKFGIGTARELHVYKKKDGKWNLWKKAMGPVMSSESGGVMGDPFQEVKVDNGAIVLTQSGGSRYKWDYTHRFRFQDNDWKLIGATYVTGTPCEYWENFDYNLSIGTINYEIETEDCSQSEDNPKVTKSSKTFTNKLKALPNMDGFSAGGNSVELKGTKETFHY